MESRARPFRGTEALAAGLVTRRTLRSRHRRIFRDVYLANDAPLTTVAAAEAAWLFADRKATLAGISAAALHGAKWLDARLPPELIRADAGCRGLVVHRVELPPDEICTIAGMPVTTPARTAYDLGRRKGLTQAVIRLDALANATGLTAPGIAAVLDRHRGARGSVLLRRALALMDSGAESPPETRTRLALLGAGLRRPQTQIVVHDDGGYPFARIDMGYEEFRVGIEYDGAQHWTDARQRAHDIERHHELAELGWAVVRVSAEMLRNRPWLIADRARQALTLAGCPWVDECAVVARRSARRVS
ncbi:MAG: DUF559 domain-containing protein [Mycobacterium sp.]|nr:DUF559 domain-containing protein [Mycobacterium sp.]